MARLASHVVLRDERQELHVFGPDDDVPAWARKRITNPKAWESGADTADEGTPSPPPKGGPGSGKDAWVAYAAASNVDIDGAETRDDIVAALDAAGVPTE